MKQRLMIVSMMLTILFSIGLFGCSLGITCAMADCNNDRLNDGKYCRDHTCVVKDCFLAKVDGDCCKKHACEIDGCGLQKKGEYYCKEHQCLIEGCDNIRVGKRYCEEHYSCALCNNERKTGRLYCEEHGCNYAGCGNLKADNLECCEKHKCKISDCTETMVSGSITYCHKHKCEQTGCDELRIANSVYCQQHYEEEIAAEQAKKEAEEYMKSIEKEIEEGKKEVEEAKKDTLVVDYSNYGQGKKVWKVLMISDTFHFKGTYDGNGYFTVKLLNSNQEHYKLICNEIGDYVIDKKVTVQSGKHYYIQIEWSDGTWSCNWTGTYGK